MNRRIKKLFTLGFLGGGVFAAYKTVLSTRGNNEPTHTPPHWPPFAETAAQPVVHNIVQSEAKSDWVAPTDGKCPPGFPIKANDNSRIYHVPGGRSYQRTVAERCYATAEAAERDGYRAAKV
jgi:hypothetical protein